MTLLFFGNTFSFTQNSFLFVHQGVNNPKIIGLLSFHWVGVSFMKWRLVASILLSCLLTSTAFAANKEKIVLVSGLDFTRTGQCGFKSCTDNEYLYSHDLSSILNQELNSRGVLADIYTFSWSRDMVTHGENLKTKFTNWFYKNICKEGQECYVSFISHSWGTVIASDFLASLASNSTIKVRTVVTFASPVTGAQTLPWKEVFWLTGVKKVLSASNQINGVAARWVNVVNRPDPIAWDIPQTENLQPNGTASTKGRLNAVFPVSNSELNPLYLGASIVKAYLNKGEDFHNVIVKSWGGGTPDLKAHAPASYEPKRLVQYVTNRLPTSIPSSSTAPAAVVKINQCVAKFSSYFGTKVGAPSLSGNYYSQNTTGGTAGKVTQIMVHKNLAESDFLYYWGGWNRLALSNCN
jgi:hypothetical protein